MQLTKYRVLTSRVSREVEISQFCVCMSLKTLNERMRKTRCLFDCSTHVLRHFNLTAVRRAALTRVERSSTKHRRQILAQK